MKYYYIPYKKDTELEPFDSFYNAPKRAGEFLRFEDYPTHRHESYGYVHIMELIPEKRMMSVKYLRSHIGRFSILEADRENVFREAGSYWLAEFEKAHNTEIYRQHNSRKEKRS